MILYKRIRIFDCPIDMLTLDETVELIDNVIKNNKEVQHCVVDPGKLTNMRLNKMLHKYVVSSDIINADGLSLVWLSKFYKQSLPERVTGIDLMMELIKLAADNHYKIFFFGATEENIEKAIENILKDYSPDIIAGYRNGYFNADEEEAIVQQIVDSKAQILFVGISSPKKEQFLYRNRNRLKPINLKMGVGGAFDVVAGRIKRAPLWMQKLCLEWFYRFMQEPRKKWKDEVVDSFHFFYLFVKERCKMKYE
jgi:N-acetylglucosaminyldiphosphoundecaprenol N-acetyl-beta-D-mannosaminyltransferase